MTNGPTVVLLGAGASVEAGVPASSDLTQAIVEGLEASRPNRFSPSPGLYALNVAIGAMVAHDTARGGRPYDGIDVERLFSAIEMLSERDVVEIAPFVAAWNAGLDGIPRTEPVGQDLASAIADLVDDHGRGPNSSAGHRIDQALAAAVQEITGGYDGETFRQLQASMIDQLRTCLDIQAGDSDYLAPLLNASGIPVQIATLNYDRTVEMMAARQGRSLSTGLPQWSGGFEWSWPSDVDVKLLKLHGSLDWTVVSKYEHTANLKAAPAYVEAGTDGPLPQGRLGVVFGQRGKVRSDGPFSAMLREFDSWIQGAGTLIVVGYSFRDEHINGILRHRIAADPTLPIVLIDPGIPDPSQPYGHWHSEGPFRRELIQAMTERHDDTTTEGHIRRGRQVRAHHRVLRVGAGAGLVEALGASVRQTQPEGAESHG